MVLTQIFLFFLNRSDKIIQLLSETLLQMKLLSIFHPLQCIRKQPLMLREAADSSLQPGCTRSGCTVSLPQSFFLPKEFRQTRDQFPRQTSKLRLSHLAHTRFFLEGMTMMSSKDTSTPGSQLSHWGDLLSVSRRQCSAWSTHRLPHAQRADAHAHRAGGLMET